MAYLELSNPTSDSCDFKVRLSNPFNTDYYRRLRITKKDYGNSTSSVSSYLESRTAGSSPSKYVTGVVNNGLSAGRTYKLYAYAQAANGTWYLAGSDYITMEEEVREYDYEIESINPNKSEPFKIGDGVEFEIEVYNYKTSEGPDYRVLLEDSNGNTVGSRNRYSLDGKETEFVTLATSINEDDVFDGKVEFTFIVESRESGWEDSYSRDNTEIVEYRVNSAEVKYEIDHIPIGKKRTGRSMNPTTLTIHSTGNAKSTARNERAWLTNPDNTSSTGFHIVVDENRAIEVIPFDETAYHAGDGGNGPGNTTSIGLEICEPGDRLQTLENAASVAAKILNDYGWGTDKLRQHYDWSGKNCPQILRDPTSRGGESYQTWDWFVNKVEQAM